MTCPGLGNDRRPWRSVLEVIRCPALSGYPVDIAIASLVELAKPLGGDIFYLIPCPITLYPAIIHPFL